MTTCLHAWLAALQVPTERLEGALLRAVTSSVAKAGVDLNRMKDRPHLHAPLQFVPGLGPRKAAYLLQFLNLEPQGIAVGGWV